MDRRLAAFIFLGLVSLFADVTYEGARSVIGSYLRVLGALSLVAGSVAFGDFLSYAVRGLSGLLSRRIGSSRAYWSLIFLGYSINLFAVPALSLTGNWLVALALIMVERIGKGLRTPLRDAVLAEVTEGIGRGKGFGIHEVMDQVGGVAGPLFVGYSLMRVNGSYRWVFAHLAIPAVVAIALLLAASVNYPRIKGVSIKAPSKGSLGRGFWLYTASMSLLALGFAHWALIAYHLRSAGELPDYWIAYMYTVAMLTDAAIAFPAGYLYDRVGPKTLAVAPPLAAASTIALFSPVRSFWVITASAAAWGVLMGLYETNMRVAVADLSPQGLRAYAYGMYGVVFGTSWGLGNLLMSFIYGFSIKALITYVLIVELASAAVLTYLLRSGFKPRDGMY